ncbi:hypothetical protein QYE76_020008 [Lolium multiflorum]|uniref:Uncharacterized protein n=1 Tax=Lolium multiflorum TaxID=4521 RepID=A0AAD8R520_LOLMU|nr:hypothetical protein QYE76_020008 [Lolium multiflorum]
MGPHEEVSYISPPNPYDTWMTHGTRCLAATSAATTRTSTPRLGRCRGLQVGQYISYFAKGVYRCPFCTRRLSGTNFNCLLTHAEDIGKTFPKIGATMNVYSFRAKHKALSIHLRNLHRVEISAGRMPPLKPKVSKGSNKWRQSQMG